MGSSTRDPKEDDELVIVARLLRRWRLLASRSRVSARVISIEHARRHGGAGRDSRRAKGHSQQEAHRGWPVAWTSLACSVRRDHDRPFRSVTYWPLMRVRASGRVTKRNGDDEEEKEDNSDDVCPPMTMCQPVAALAFSLSLLSPFVTRACRRVSLSSSSSSSSSLTRNLNGPASSVHYPPDFTCVASRFSFSPFLPLSRPRPQNDVCAQRTVITLRR